MLKLYKRDFLKTARIGFEDRNITLFALDASKMIVEKW